MMRNHIKHIITKLKVLWVFLLLVVQRESLSENHCAIFSVTCLNIIQNSTKEAQEKKKMELETEVESLKKELETTETELRTKIKEVSVFILSQNTFSLCQIFVCF